MKKNDYYLIIKPLLTDGECGDTVIIKEFDNKVFIGIVDVVGHGREAYEVILICKKFLEKNYSRDLVDVMKGVHEQVKGTRGLVCGLSHLDQNTGILKYVGVGNIVARKFGSSSVRVISRSGVVGYAIPTPREEIMNLYDGDVLVFYTDGVKEHFELEDYPELLVDDVETIAKNIIHLFGKENDDAACIVLRYKK